MYTHKGLFNIIYSTWGNYITLHGNFSKYDALSLTQEDFSYESLIKPEPIKCKPISFIDGARKILLE